MSSLLRPSKPRPPIIVCEISGNHCGDFNTALRLIDAAKEAGADFCKTQCYEAHTITIDHNSDDFILHSGPWKGKNLFELYESAETPLSWHAPLYEYAKKVGIGIFSSVFDYSSIGLLETLGCPIYKIASFEIIDLPLIQKAAQTGKELIISTGMATSEEIREAFQTCGGHATMLHCVSSYPTPVEGANLQQFRHLKDWTPYAGVSDHSLGYEIPVAATALGATVIEKHLTLSRSNGSPDAGFSLEPHEFKEMVDKVRAVWAGMGPSTVKGEEDSRQARRSLYIVADVIAGERLTWDNVRSIRPGNGMLPKHLPDVLGRRVVGDIKKGTPLAWKHLTPR